MKVDFEIDKVSILAFLGLFIVIALFLVVELPSILSKNTYNSDNNVEKYITKDASILLKNSKDMLILLKSYDGGQGSLDRMLKYMVREGKAIVVNEDVVLYKESQYNEEVSIVIYNGSPYYTFDWMIEPI